jgi:hypothetical protein
VAFVQEFGSDFMIHTMTRKLSVSLCVLCAASEGFDRIITSVDTFLLNSSCFL